MAILLVSINFKQKSRLFFTQRISACMQTLSFGYRTDLSIEFVINVALIERLRCFSCRNCMREKISIVKSHRDFAKAQGEDPI